MKKVICRTHDLNSFQIIEAQHGVKPANFICDAPEGVEVGDEDLITISGQSALVDYELLKQKREKKPGWFSRKK